jgi:single-strand DNA-binding protein
LRQEKWVDKETGKNRSKLKVHGLSFTFLNRGQGDGGGGGGGGGNRTQNRQQGNPRGNGGQRSAPQEDDGNQGSYEDYATSLPSDGQEEPPF